MASWQAPGSRGEKASRADFYAHCFRLRGLFICCFLLIFYDYLKLPAISQPSPSSFLCVLLFCSIVNCCHWKCSKNFVKGIARRWKSKGVWLHVGSSRRDVWQLLQVQGDTISISNWHYLAPYSTSPQPGTMQGDWLLASTFASSSSPSSPSSPPSSTTSPGSTSRLPSVISPLFPSIGCR